MKVLDPLKLAELCWPHITFYKEQRDIIYSVRDNDETYVPAGNMLGKDFVAAFIALWFFLSRKPCRVVTTSVDGTQLQVVLWGEIKRFIQESRYPLPIINNHCHLKKLVNGEECGLSYLLGRVSAKGEGMSGHHVAKTGDGIPRTLFIADEASGVDDENKKMADAWAYRVLVIGNPFPCQNFFYKGVKAGDVVDKQNPERFYSKVIRIRAEDSPNVRYGLAQEKDGKNGKATGKMLIPGVISYRDYVKRREMWDPMRQCIGLDGEFYEGPGVLLYPPTWLNKAEKRTVQQGRRRTLGVDSAQGGDNTAFAVCSDYGLLELISLKTPDTTTITSQTLALMKTYNIKPENVLFDGGGGGKQHVDRLRRQGHHKIQIIMFGSAATPRRRRGMTPFDARSEEEEVRMVFKNRRCEMYGMLRYQLDPGEGGKFAIGAKYQELRRQLAVMPLQYNDEGVMVLPPKNRRDPKDTRTTLTEMLGCSPDEADALVLANFGLVQKSIQRTIGAIV